MTPSLAPPTGPWRSLGPARSRRSSSDGRPAATIRRVRSVRSGRFGRIRRTLTAVPIPVIGMCVMLAMLVAPVAGSAPATAQEVRLRWDFQEGAEHRYRQILTSRTTTPMGAVSQTQTMVLRQDVTSVSADGTADLRVTHESVRMEAESPMGSESYDSEAGDVPADPGMAVLAGLVGASFEVRISPEGEVREVSGIDRMMEDVLSSVAEVDPAVADQARPVIEQMLGERSQESFMRQWMQGFPAEPVAPGATWTGETVVSLPFGTLRSKYEYTFRDVTSEAGRRIARIGVIGTVGELEPDPTNPMGGTLEISGGEAEGEIAFDVDRGVLNRSVVESGMTATAGGQSMEIVSSFRMELVEP